MGRKACGIAHCRGGFQKERDPFGQSCEEKRFGEDGKKDNKSRKRQHGESRFADSIGGKGKVRG